MHEQEQIATENTSFSVRCLYSPKELGFNRLCRCLFHSLIRKTQVFSDCTMVIHIQVHFELDISQDIQRPLVLVVASISILVSNRRCAETWLLTSSEFELLHFAGFTHLEVLLDVVKGYSFSKKY